MGVTKQEVDSLREQIALRYSFKRNWDVVFPNGVQGKSFGRDFVEKVTVFDGIKVYIADGMDIVDLGTGKKILTVEAGSYKEFSRVVPRVRRLDKVYIFQKLKAVVDQEDKLFPVYVNKKPIADNKGNSLLLLRQGIHSHARCGLRDLAYMIEYTYSLGEENFEVMSVVVASTP